MGVAETTIHQDSFRQRIRLKTRRIFQLLWHFQDHFVNPKEPMALSNHGKQQLDDALSTIEDVLGTLRPCDGPLDVTPRV